MPFAYVMCCKSVCMYVCVLSHGPFFRSWVTRLEARLGFAKLAKEHVEIFVICTETYIPEPCQGQGGGGGGGGRK